MLKTPKNKVFSILQTIDIRALLRKNNNIKDNKNNDDSSSITVEKSGTANNKNLISRLDFLIFKIKISFTQLKKIFIKALILHYFKLD